MSNFGKRAETGSAEVKDKDAFDFLVIVVLRKEFGRDPRIWIIPKREILSPEATNGTRTITVTDLRGPLAKYENNSALKSFPPDPNVEAPKLEAFGRNTFDRFTYKPGDLQLFDKDGNEKKPPETLTDG